MRDLRIDEVGHIYGAGGRGSCRPARPKNPCRPRGGGSGSRKGGGSGSRSKGRGRCGKGGGSS